MYFWEYWESYYIYVYFESYIWSFMCFVNMNFNNFYLVIYKNIKSISYYIFM